MGTTGGAIAAITFSEDQLDPYVTHAPTRRRLTGPGLPGDSSLLTFAALRTGGAATFPPGPAACNEWAPAPGS